MKQLIALVFILICFKGVAQTTYPVATIPNPKADSSFGRYGYLQFLTLSIDAVGDTMIRPRLAGSSRTWIHGGNTEVWKWNGTRWVKTGTSASGGGSGIAEVTGTLPIVVTNGTTTPNVSITPFKQNGVVSGGIITWLSGYTYNVSAANYYIDGVFYQSLSTDITLDAADPTDDRIDLFLLTTSSTAVDITGTPSTPPVSPDYDANIQINIGFATVEASSTEPTITNDWIYQENIEWTTAVSAGTINPASTNNPYAGSLDVEGTSVLNGQYITFTSTPNMSLYDIFSFQIRSKANFSTTKKIIFQWYNGTTAIGNPVPLGSGSYGFISTNTTTYQAISIPLSDFGNITGATTLRATQSNTSGNQGWYLDNLQLQDGTVPIYPYILPIATASTLGGIKVGANLSINPVTGVLSASAGVGTVTSIATNNATGLYGGTITGSGTLYIDTTIISTRAWRDKLADSLGALIAAKTALNGTGYVRMSGTTPSYQSNTQLTADVNTFTQTLSGAVPAPTTLNNYVLRDDGTWVAQSGGGATDTTTQLYGSIYNENTWSTLGDFTNNGSTSSVVSNKIQFSGGAGTFTQSLDLATYTNLEKWKMTAKVLVGTKNGTSYGFGMGVRSTNSYGLTNSLGRFDMSNGGSSGTLILNTGTANTSVGTSSAISFSVSDYILLTVERDVDSLIVSAFNYTTKTAVQRVAYQWTNASPFIHNTGRFAIFSLGGTFTVDSLSIESNEIKYAPLMVIGDSKTQLYYASTFANRYGFLLGKIYTPTVISAGGSDRTADVVNRLPEILALRPKNVTLAIGSNDIRSGVSSATYFANYANIVNTLHASGINVWHTDLFYETSISQATLRNHITATYSADSIIKVYDIMEKTPSVLNADGVHPNDAGNQVIANAINSSNKILAGNKIYDYTRIGGGNVTGSGVATRIPFWSSTTALSSSANLYWDNVNSRLSVGTGTSPAYKVDITTSNVNADGVLVTNSNAGINSAASVLFKNNLGVSGNFATYSSTYLEGYANNSAFGANRELFLVSGNTTTSGTPYGITFRTGGYNATQTRMKLNSTGILMLNNTSDSTTGRFVMNGDLSLNTAGNKIKIATGSNASVGVSGAMTAGTITISTTAVTADSKIFLTHATIGGTAGVLSVGTITAGTSFVINSTSGTDTGTINWWIVN